MSPETPNYDIDPEMARPNTTPDIDKGISANSGFDLGSMKKDIQESINAQKDMTSTEINSMRDISDKINDSTSEKDLVNTIDNINKLKIKGEKIINKLEWTLNNPEALKQLSQSEIISMKNAIKSTKHNIKVIIWEVLNIYRKVWIKWIFNEEKTEFSSLRSDIDKYGLTSKWNSIRNELLREELKSWLENS